jgi:hypothetical protein
MGKICDFIVIHHTTDIVIKHFFYIICLTVDTVPNIYIYKMKKRQRSIPLINIITHIH